MMDPRLYDVVFAGELVAGTDPAAAKQRLAALFKSDVAAIERLFSGQPVVIRKGLDETTAARYREALRQAGAVCKLREAGTAAAPASPAPAAPSAAPASTPPAVAEPSHEDAPAGSLATAAILPAGTPFPQRPEVKAPSYDLSAFSLAEAGAELPRPAPVAPAPLPDISGITLAPAGSALGEK